MPLTKSSRNRPSYTSSVFGETVSVQVHMLLLDAMKVKADSFALGIPRGPKSPVKVLFMDFGHRGPIQSPTLNPKPYTLSLKPSTLSRFRALETSSKVR